MFKATQPDGTDFYTGKISYLNALKTGDKLIHPNPGVLRSGDASGYISISTVATDCTSFRWPARLFEVEPVGDVWAPSSSMPNKRAVAELRILRELPAWQLFGPEGERIVELIAKFGACTSSQRVELRAAYLSSRVTFDRAWSAVAGDGRAVRAGLRAARRALYDRLYGWGVDGAACGAALALLCRPLVGDVFTQEEYDTLSAPWRTVMGEIHPDDKPVTR